VFLNHKKEEQNALLFVCFGAQLCHILIEYFIRFTHKNISKLFSKYLVKTTKNFVQKNAYN